MPSTSKLSYSNVSMKGIQLFRYRWKQAYISRLLVLYYTQRRSYTRNITLRETAIASNITFNKLVSGFGSRLHDEIYRSCSFLSLSLLSNGDRTGEKKKKKLHFECRNETFSLENSNSNLVKLRQTAMIPSLVKLGGIRPEHGFAKQRAKNLERAEHPRGQYPRRKTHARSIARHPSSVIYEQHPEKEKRSKRARPSVARVVKRYPPPSFTRCKCRPLEQPSQPHHQLGHRPTDPHRPTLSLFIFASDQRELVTRTRQQTAEFQNYGSLS